MCGIVVLMLSKYWVSKKIILFSLNSRFIFLGIVRRY